MDFPFEHFVVQFFLGKKCLTIYIYIHIYIYIIDDINMIVPTNRNADTPLDFFAGGHASV